MTIGSKLDPHPLDGKERAKPDEPTFTLQGGDKFSHAALKSYIQKRRQAAIKLPESPQREEELLRCTEAEGILWAMHDYLAGRAQKDEAEEETRKAESQAIDLHGYRIWAASRLANAFSEMNDMIATLQELGFEDSAALSSIKNEIVSLRGLFNSIEPRPGQRINNVQSW